MSVMAARGPTLVRPPESLPRRTSFDDIEPPGCCSAKLFISSLVGFATRSKRKDVKDGKKRVASASLAQDRRQARKSTSTDLCVCESIDEKVVDHITTPPRGIDVREWIASHTLSLFDHMNLMCGSVSELCTPVSCPSMSYPGTSKAPYVDEKGKRHMFSAPQYVDCVMSHCEKTSRSEEVFPTKYGSEFSADFENQIRRMLRLLWHCGGHLYSRHWEEMRALELRPQCALVLAHLAVMGKRFHLLDAKDQLLLDQTVEAIRPPLTVLVGGLMSDDVQTLPEPGRATRVPSSKSGSWGGHPTPAVLHSKPYAQTC